MKLVLMIKRFTLIAIVALGFLSSSSNAASTWRQSFTKDKAREALVQGVSAAIAASATFATMKFGSLTGEGIAIFMEKDPAFCGELGSMISSIGFLYAIKVPKETILNKIKQAMLLQVSILMLMAQRQQAAQQGNISRAKLLYNIRGTWSFVSSIVTDIYSDGILTMITTKFIKPSVEWCNNPLLGLPADVFFTTKTLVAKNINSLTQAKKARQRAAHVARIRKHLARAHA